MKKEIKKEINQTLKKLNYTDSDININISVPKNKKFGDLSTNISFELSKKLKKTPLEIAEITGIPGRRFGGHPSRRFSCSTLKRE